MAGGKTLYDNDDLDDIDNIDDLDLCPVSKLGGTVEIHEANVSLTFKCNKHLHHFNVFNGIAWFNMVLILIRLSRVRLSLIGFRLVDFFLKKLLRVPIGSQIRHLWPR